MHSPLILFRPHACSRARRKFCTLALLIGLSASGLAIAPSAQAAIDCQSALPPDVMPSDADAVFRDYVIMNGLKGCILRFASERDAEALLSDYQARWETPEGRVMTPQQDDQPLSMIFENDGLNITVAINPTPAPQTIELFALSLREADAGPRIAEDIRIAGLTPVLDQSTSQGRTVFLATALSAQPTLERVTQHFREQGWTLLRPKATSRVGIKSILERDGVTLSVLVAQANRDTYIAILQFVRQG